jgi:hypothetical protein
MATFDQRGQHVTYQYNAAGNINFGAARSVEEFSRELGKLREEVARADTSGALESGVALDTTYQIDKAAQQARQASPDKDALVDHLKTAKDLIAQVGDAAGLVSGLVQAIEKVGVLF